MAVPRTNPGWIGRIVAGAAMLGAVAYGGVRAELLSDYFPLDVPGYGTAPGVTVVSRSRPEFDPPGERVGSFLLHPQWDQALGYDSNVFGGGSSERGSWVVGTHPSLLIGSDWSRNRLGGYIGVDDLRYLDQPKQSQTNWTASLGGEIAVGRDRLTLAVAHFSLHEARTQLDALPSDTPIAYQAEDARASYAIALNRFTVTPSLAFTTWRYDPTTILGVPSSQTYRDRNVLTGAVTTRYELSSQRAALLVTRAMGSHYVAPQPGAPTRDSTGYQILVGLQDDNDAVWRYRILAGEEVRAFHASQYGTRQAPIAEAALIWSPSGMTTVTADLTRSIEDAAQESVAGYTYTSARLALDHEYRRNLLLHGWASVQHAEFLQGGGAESGFSLGTGVTWLMNRHMRLSVTYDFTDQHGSGNPSATVNSYTRSIGLLTLRLGM
jgi:hypothetical protein